MLTLKTKLILGVVIQLMLLGFIWTVQDWRYIGKIASREVTYLNEKVLINQANKKELQTQQDKSNEAFSSYKANIAKLEATVASTSSALSSLRKQTSDLRTTLDGLSNETIRSYAEQCSRSFLEGAELYSDTARKADEYYYAWQALDRAWPKTESVKEVNESKP